MADPAVTARAWSELLHAQVAYQLRRADIPVLHIKGPTVALWLYTDEDDRPWGDVDVLVPPDAADEAREVLLAGGLVERFPGVTRTTSGDHAVTLAHVDPDHPGDVFSEVDLHHRFEGIGLHPEAAFAELWRRREPARLGGQEVWFPDLPSRALLVALNTARSDSPKARGDLERLVRSATDPDWRTVIALARRVDALPALRAGLECDERGRAVVASTTLAQVA